MKKGMKIFLLVAFGLILLGVFAHFIVAVDTAPAVNSPISEATLDKLSDIAAKNPEDIVATGSSYLRTEWAKIMQKNFPFLWTIHAFLKAHQLPFKILINHEYEISWTFLWIFILWIYLVNLGSDIFNSIGIIKQKAGIIAGIMFAIILSQINIINWLVGGIVHFLTSPTVWWQRLIVWLVALFFVAVFLVLERLLKKYLDEYFKERRLANIEQKEEELEAESEGREEGRRAAEPIKKLKRQLKDSG